MDSLIKSSLILLVAGMGTTFIFLIVQAIITNLSAKVTKPFAGLIPEPAPKKVVKQAAPSTDDGAVVAAIAAVLHHNA